MRSEGSRDDKSNVVVLVLTVAVPHDAFENYINQAARGLAAVLDEKLLQSSQKFFDVFHGCEVFLQ